MFAALIDALTQLGLATGVARSAAVYASVSAAHILGIALLVGPILLVDLRLLGLLRALDARSIAVLRGTARIGLGLTLVAGILLLSAKPGDYAGNAIVFVKLGVVGAAIINALAFEWQTRRVGLVALLERRGRSFAMLSMVLWLGAVLLGRWIAFV
jgi:hypothetical protein